MEISSKVGPWGGGRVTSMYCVVPEQFIYVSTWPLTANRGNTKGSVTGFRTRIAAPAGRDTAESLLPVVVATRAAAAEEIAAHGVVDVTALEVTTTKASVGRDARIVASCAKAEVATRRKLQPLMKSPTERQRCRVTRMVSR
jgi:hypothetical protein